LREKNDVSVEESSPKIFLIFIGTTQTDTNTYKQLKFDAK